MVNKLKQDALFYHANPFPGKIATQITKPAQSARDLSLAYSPGVAYPCLAISENPANAYKYTNKSNLVAVISNGSAVLGLGNLGALASKPVMEGKSLLFKKFANIDSIDIEVNTSDPQQFIDTVANIAVSFGGINLEDIKAPECFLIEQELIKQCDIPIFHDDQHGTAIVTAAGVLNALDIQGKSIDKIKLVCIGAGAAAVACTKLLFSLGLKPEQTLLVDRQGVIFQGRDNLSAIKQEFAVDTTERTLSDACRGADIILGLSGPNLITPDMVKSMANKPIIFACSNPDPEIKPELAKSVRSDIIIATGRSDYPNQVNNVLGFPFIFRGALDVRAKCINEEMKIAAAMAIKELAYEKVPAEVLASYELNHLEYGPNYIIPKPLDLRLVDKVSTAVAIAAVKSGVNQIPYIE